MAWSSIYTCAATDVVSAVAVGVASTAGASSTAAFFLRFFGALGSAEGVEAADTGVSTSAAAAGLALRECVALADRVRRTGAGEAGETSAFVLFIIQNILPCDCLHLCRDAGNRKPLEQGSVARITQSGFGSEPASIA